MFCWGLQRKSRVEQCPNELPLDSWQCGVRACVPEPGHLPLASVTGGRTTAGRAPWCAEGAPRELGGTAWVPELSFPGGCCLLLVVLAALSTPFTWKNLF